jgi:uncharacterized membrane protein (UPF0127 family)
MIRLSARSIAGCSAIFAATLAIAALGQTAAQPPLAEISLNAGLYLIRAEVANSDSTRETGLMFRKSMPANHGMLFVFDRDGVECMWMKNTVMPLSVAFIDDTGVIRNIEEMAPRTETSHCSQGPVRYGLEMNRGWFASKKIGPGTRLQGLDKAPPGG